MPARIPWYINIGMPGARRPFRICSSGRIKWMLTVRSSRKDREEVAASAFLAEAVWMGFNLGIFSGSHSITQSINQSQVIVFLLSPVVLLDITRGIRN